MGKDLPLPETVVLHHGRALFGPMSEWRSSLRIPPVLLLTGIPGVGKRSMARFLAQWILCERRPQEGDPRPCGSCASCRKAEHGTWVDFTEIETQGEETETGSARSLKVEQFRKLKATQGFAAGHESAYRVTLIPDADRMTPQAANSVLKLLEEPPRGWALLLTASDPSLLLPTIVSRCQTIRLRPFPREALLELLAPEVPDPARREICAELAQGSWRRALGWAEAESWERRKLILDFLDKPEAHLASLVDWAALDPRNLSQLIDQLESLLSELIRWTLGGTAPEDYAWRNADARAPLIRCARQATGGARERWLELAERLARARKEMQAPLNRKLLAQDLLLPWLA